MVFRSRSATFLYGSRFLCVYDQPLKAVLKNINLRLINTNLKLDPDPGADKKCGSLTLLLGVGDEEDDVDDQEEVPNPGMPEPCPEMPPPQVQPKKRCHTCSFLAPNRKAAVNLKKVSEFPCYVPLVFMFPWSCLSCLCSHGCFVLCLCPSFRCLVFFM